MRKNSNIVAMLCIQKLFSFGNVKWVVSDIVTEIEHFCCTLFTIEFDNIDF